MVIYPDSRLHDARPLLARDVRIALTAADDSSITNILASAYRRGQGRDRVALSLATGGGQMLLSCIARRSRDQLGLTAGMEMYAQVESVALIA